MLKLTRKPLLLLLVFVFSFIYRLIFMLWNGFPSGADIGLHNSVIYSITASGNTNFLWNFYQIGGGLSLTFPGYHIFTASVIFMTGLPEYIAQAVVVSLFSALLVLAAFLITRKIWNEPAAFIVAFLVAISRFDIEMLLWGGYPNVITLLLIPLTFYLYLQKERFSTTPFLACSSLLVASLFLSHSLSAAIFVGITFLAVLAIFVAPKSLGVTRKTGVYWLLPIFIGVALASPFIANAVPAYLSDNSTFNVSDGTDAINAATLSTRILPLELVLPLFLIIPAFLLFSKKYQGKYLTLSTFLLCSWIFVPLFLTQGYLFGFVIDYNRFLYFVILPIMMFIAMLIDHGSDFFAKTVDAYRILQSQKEQAKLAPTPKNQSAYPTRLQRAIDRQNQKAKQNADKAAAWISKHATHKTVYSLFLLGFLLFSFFAIPIFMTPIQGRTIENFYQFMDDPSWEAIQWLKENTPADAILVADAHYGWWLSGFALRPTLSAVDPQYLTLAREFPLAKNASNLLDTNYLVDNGLVQVREDGGYIARHNPEILANLNWTYFPYSFFNFDSNQNIIKYSVDGVQYSTSLDQLAVLDMYMTTYPQTDPDYNLIVVCRGNEFFNYTQYTTIYRGVRFVNLTATLDTVRPDVALNWLDIDLESKGITIPYADSQTIGLIDLGVKTFGQLIFNEKQPAVTAPTEHSNKMHLEYNLQNQAHFQFQIQAAAYSVTDSLQYYTDQQTMNNYFVPLISANLNSFGDVVSSEGFVESFDYKISLQDHNVSYVILHAEGDQQMPIEMASKFLHDPAFDLVFINSEVAIFQVVGNLNQDG
jgi:hypothetical protein